MSAAVCGPFQQQHARLATPPYTVQRLQAEQGNNRALGLAWKHILGLRAATDHTKGTVDAAQQVLVTGPGSSQRDTSCRACATCWQGPM